MALRFTGRLGRAFVVIAAAVALAGCSTITEIAVLPPIIGVELLGNVALDAVATPVPVASAGADQQTLVNERTVLDGSRSGVRKGSGSIDTAPTPAPTFAWQIVASPVADSNGDGVVDATDFTAAGVRLDLADTRFPQFVGNVAGAYTIQVTVGWTNLYGITTTSTDQVVVQVFTPAP